MRFVMSRSTIATVLHKSYLGSLNTKHLIFCALLYIHCKQWQGGKCISLSSSGVLAAPSASEKYESKTKKAFSSQEVTYILRKWQHRCRILLWRMWISCPPWLRAHNTLLLHCNNATWAFILTDAFHNRSPLNIWLSHASWGTLGSWLSLTSWKAHYDRAIVFSSTTFITDQLKNTYLQKALYFSKMFGTSSFRFWDVKVVQFMTNDKMGL